MNATCPEHKHLEKIDSAEEIPECTIGSKSDSKKDQ